MDEGDAFTSTSGLSSNNAWITSAWPQCAAARPERRHDKEKPAGIDLPTWRLQRGIELARTHAQRVPQCVGASVLAAETLADLPFDTVEHIVKKHPLSAVAMALAAGYVVAKDPHNATRGVQRVLSGLL